MGREVRRVPLDFNWLAGEVWQGYLMLDLPEGSVVATTDRVWIKDSPDAIPWTRWPMWCPPEAMTDANVDELLRDGAKVLRVGTGQEG